MAGGRAPFVAPLRPSNLRISSGPKSPASPLTPSPSLTPPVYTHIGISVSSMSDLPPLLPPSWTWSCHVCHSSFPLGVTRRCLHDGHLFCSGTTVDKYSNRTRKHKPCGSVFDYVGWKNWGEWRRASDQYSGGHDHPSGKDCVNRCDFPSECRWAKKHSSKPTRTNSHSAISAASARRNTSIARLQRLVDSAEQRTAQLADLLSPIEEHEEGGYKDPDVDFPVLDFSAFKASLDAVHGCPAIDEKSSTLQMSVLEIDGAIDAEMADVDMTEPPLVRILDPASTTASENLDEEFGFDSCSSETDAAEASPTSPRRNAWDWTIDGIGVALSIPDGLFKGERELDADGMDFEK